MATPLQVIKAMTNYNSIAVLDRSISDYDAQQSILDLNREQLRRFGTDANGKKLRPKYSYYYNLTKKYDGSVTAPTPDLYKSGAMQEGLVIEVERSGVYRIDSPDTPYTGYLVERYGGDIFGIQKKNIGKVKKIILPIFHTFNRKRLGL